jgi:hypothetical protein
VNPRRSLLVATLLAAVAVPLAAADGAAFSHHVRALPDIRALDRAPAPVSSRFTGIDGHQHNNAPLAVTGRKGWLYFGADFDLACSFGGPKLKKAADQLARVANIIRKSGRRVVWTMAPNKTGPLARYVKTNKYPHANCDKQGLTEQTKLLRTYDAPGYLPMVDPLATSKHEVYWKTDPHWSTVGGSVYAKEVAQVLNPRLAKLQRSRYGTETGVGSLNLLRGITTPETLERAFPATKVRVKPEPSDTPWTGYPELTFDHSWDTKPASKTWRGKTLVIGDSFSMFALESLRPLFRHGRWMWFAHVALQDLVKAIKRSDTVVMEVVQLYVPGSILATKNFQVELKRALN